MKTTPRISVVTPSLNQGRFLERNIQSVLAQDYPDFEHIVIDAESTDETLEVLERYPSVRWVSEPDDGQTNAINKGFAMSGGDVFAYLNSDDVYRPGAFTKAVAAFQDPLCQVVAGNCDILDENGVVSGEYRAELSAREDLLRYWRWGKGVCIPQPAVFVRRNLIEQLGGFDEAYDMAMDFEMWLRLAKRAEFTILDETLAGFRVTPETKTSRRKFDMVVESFRAAKAHLSVAPPGRRLALALELHRETAGHLVTIAEELIGQRQSTEALVHALKVWPLAGGSPRVWRLMLRAMAN